MSYARNLLSRGEEVIFESRQHWFAVLAETWAFIIIAVLAFAILIWSSTSDLGTVGSLLGIVSLIALVVCLVQIGLKVWAWRNQEYLVTNRRVIKSEGIFNKNMGDSSLNMVNDAHLSQSLLGRIFNFGSLEIMTAAEEADTDMLSDFTMLADPVQFKIAMLNAKDQLLHPDLAPAPRQRPEPMPELQRAAMPPRAGSERVSQVPQVPQAGASTAPAPTAASASGSSSATAADELAVTLERLAGLRDRGLITPEEYESKKRELLGRM
jgi:membrane protein YdbS with pleckstrin-like domain